MSKYEELEAKGNELVEKRNKATGSERELLNKEIKAIRQAQLNALAEEITADLKLAIPEMVSIAIKSSGVLKAIEELKDETNG
ncbi:CFAP141 family protein [Escherichia coli]